MIASQKSATPNSDSRISKPNLVQLRQSHRNGKDLPYTNNTRSKAGMAVTRSMFSGVPVNNSHTAKVTRSDRARSEGSELTDLMDLDVGEDITLKTIGTQAGNDGGRSNKRAKEIDLDEDDDDEEETGEELNGRNEQSESQSSRVPTTNRTPRNADESDDEDEDDDSDDTYDGDDTSTFRACSKARSADYPTPASTTGASGLTKEEMEEGLRDAKRLDDEAATKAMIDVQKKLDYKAASDEERELMRRHAAEQKMELRRKKGLHASNPEYVEKRARALAERNPKTSSGRHKANTQVRQSQLDQTPKTTLSLLQDRRFSAEGLGTQKLPKHLRDDASLLKNDDYLERSKQARLAEAALKRSGRRPKMVKQCTGVLGRSAIEAGDGDGDSFD